MMVFKSGPCIVREFHPMDIAPIAKNVREIDREDIETLFNVTPEQSVRSSARVSTHKFTVLFDNQVVAILGLMPETLLSDRALVWMVTTRAIQKVPISFLRGSKKFLEQLFTFYPKLYGIVRNENICSSKWLRWMGAKMTAFPDKNYHQFSLGEI